MNPNHLSSAPAPILPQFRRCLTCTATRVCEPSPSTALPCKCGGELLVSAVGVTDLFAERKRCADALERLAVKCEQAGAGSAAGFVKASGAAQHMRDLATWMLAGEGV